MQAKKYSIRDWPKEDRPREKLLSKNPSILTDSELIAILLNNGFKDRSAVDLAKEILHLSKNNLNELGKLSAKELMKIKGVGEAKATAVAVAVALADSV